MDPVNQKSLERVVSQRALQMGSSFPCQICVVGLLCGVCLTSLFLAALTSFGSFEFAGISFSSISVGSSPWNSSSDVVSTDCKFKLKETERWIDSPESKTETDDERVSLLYSAWGALLTESVRDEREFWQKFGLNRSSVPKAPHLENCQLSSQTNTRLDTRAENESFPPWTSWKGLLDMYPASAANEQLRYRHRIISEGAYPPWITGSDEENYPLTRKVQRDIWIHQHPPNCRDPSVRFLVADWERIPGFGIGAQIAGMCGLLAIAINEKRVLVTNYYNRADHDGCKDSSRSSWSCYFFPETSQECRHRAFELMGNKEAWEMGIIKTKENYTSKEIWTGRIPRVWGDPWSYLQPTTEINGTLLAYHRKMDRRWWRAQAVRYLMRFTTEYTCGLLNIARHAAFSKEAAKMVLTSLPKEWPKEVGSNVKTDIEQFVWSNHRPWISRPLLSMHVRMGDKACEMKVVEFEEYMHLADRVRKHFPHLNSIWLSTEMQEVIDKSKLYPRWNFYYTNVTRQVGNITMAVYEASLGRETSTNYPLVNFLMAVESDFFIGALGSTWCFLVDGMRNTGGKVMSGYLSVNKDRFW
ncbi:Alpha-(1,6)-fucosyltransferase [Melia azedarach]|uniref:Alpha-(1,6)-fucosyltransferase n=2 Tax=Melia azedarach TaxID=155640 RepID=A0ACC1Y844_MELAZ|nr:Alpha-(1,6)-fucosyltransferase [Melia azedarach]KAJ4719750.1 Alpha-(1,6)-fucosyltransferase [Melia azedarach]